MKELWEAWNVYANMVFNLGNIRNLVKTSVPEFEVLGMVHEFSKDKLLELLDVTIKVLKENNNALLKIYEDNKEQKTKAI